MNRVEATTVVHLCLPHTSSFSQNRACWEERAGRRTALQRCFLKLDDAKQKVGYQLERARNTNEECLHRRVIAVTTGNQKFCSSEERGNIAQLEQALAKHK